MILLNLGCGKKTHPEAINIDWSPYLMIKSNPVLKFAVSLYLPSERKKHLSSLPDKIMAHNLRRGIPFKDGEVDAIYHSHMLEHIDRDSVAGFLRECLRVLRPGGIHRICVPDMEFLATEYLASVNQRKLLQSYKGRDHDYFVSEIIEQIARKESHGLRGQPPFRAAVERWVLGDARARGETHQWMYDFYNLSDVLERAGFVDIRRCAWGQSMIPGWEAMGLERDVEGREYKTDSLYVECRKAG